MGRMLITLAHMNNYENKSPINLLSHEKSPYLLQHKDNPIAWRAWGEEAFRVARHEKKPVCRPDTRLAIGAM